MVGSVQSDKMSEALMPGPCVSIPRDDILRLINPTHPRYGNERCLVGKTPKNDWVLLRGSLEDLATIRQAGLCDPDLTKKLNEAEQLGLLELREGGPNCRIAVQPRR